MSEVLCEKCVGLCCRYLALPIDTPKTKGDFDDVRWYLAHEGISVFVEEGDWYINIANRCNLNCAICFANAAGFGPRRSIFLSDGDAFGQFDMMTAGNGAVGI